MLFEVLSGLGVSYKSMFNTNCIANIKIFVYKQKEPDLWLTVHHFVSAGEEGLRGKLSKHNEWNADKKRNKSRDMKRKRIKGSMARRQAQTQDRSRGISCLGYTPTPSFFFLSFLWLSQISRAEVSAWFGWIQSSNTLPPLSQRSAEKGRWIEMLKLSAKLAQYKWQRLHP